MALRAGDADLGEYPESDVLAADVGGESPSNWTRSDFGLVTAIVWVESTCSSSLVPQANASAPSPPTVLAWLSGQA